VRRRVIICLALLLALCLLGDAITMLCSGASAARACFLLISARLH